MGARHAQWQGKTGERTRVNELVKMRKLHKVGKWRTYLSDGAKSYTSYYACQHQRKHIGKEVVQSEAS